jgi:hypothetical protein
MDQELANVYSRSVSPRGQVRMSGGGSFGGTSFERDPHFISLEQSVFSKISELTKEEQTTPRPENKSNGLRVVSVEDAIKELQMLESNGVV